MFIHEATFSLKMHPQSAICRTKWIVKGVIEKRIMTGLDHLHLFELCELDGTPAAMPWIPTLEDIAANDWLLMSPILKKGKRVGWRMVVQSAARDHLGSDNCGDRRDHDRQNDIK